LRGKRRGRAAAEYAAGVAFGLWRGMIGRWRPASRRADQAPAMGRTPPRAANAKVRLHPYRRAASQARVS